MNEAPKCQTLSEYIAQHSKEPRPPFVPNARYQLFGDHLYVLWEDVEYYHDGEAHEFDLLREIGTERIVGVKLFQVGGMVDGARAKEDELFQSCVDESLSRKEPYPQAVLRIAVSFGLFILAMAAVWILVSLGRSN